MFGHQLLANRLTLSSRSRPPRASRRGRRPNLETLEGRSLLAAGLTTVSVPIAPAPIEGSPLSNVIVARFSDADKNVDPGQYSAVIQWGNGASSKGTVVVDPKGGFDVTGSYTYPKDGTYTVSVSIVDKDGDQATAKTTNLVGDAPISATGVTVDLSSPHGLKNAVVARFTDANPSGVASDFAATVAWGDGTTSTGRVVPDPSGGFDVRGSHRFAVAGSYAISVQIRDGGPNAVATQFYTTENLISDGAVPADHIDPTLVNPWGIAAGATGGPFWINNNGTGISELDDGAGNQSQGLPFVTVPPPGGSPAGTTSAPTGIVVQNTTAHPNDFVVSTKVGSTTVSGPAIFLFATEDGTISGWNPKVNFTNAILAVDDSASNAVFKGLALTSIPAGGLLPAGQYLFATDFHNDKIDVFNSNFAPVTLAAGAFHDPSIPAGYAPFGIQAIGGNLFVTYAQQNAARHDDVAGVGHGFVDEFNANGFLVQHLGGAGVQPELNSPWGVTQAPANFGAFSNDILVGNFGDSHISAFDPNTGAFLGQVSDAQGHPITFDGGFKGPDSKGLWGISFGNGNGSGNTNTLYFNSGINDESDGVFGALIATSSSTATASSIGFATADSTANPGMGGPDWMKGGSSR